ncbi:MULTISPECIES: hypothetical protein [Pseudomonas]|uniref:Lipoprotein n=1 Tax=Pseudomonas neustonica TaxID=2487346 RepID=A0ABX9XHW8_9PSED|nr:MULTISPECIES: hypothetical protein [Pseudomonas]MBA6421059.1 hypothetical protein [Pseudomonas sp. 5Ae-yellow]ROZ82793.1 hypothetical protein EF099_11280 [Pseudomonas sp. SSM44]ROZ84746.1 hypothetical protein EF096_10140 [Pseudomonas neustonica]|tara:strand:+ start:765 stop:1253 length:489 start_codon:yes stop_codon:yes gene_type:complete
MSPDVIALFNRCSSFWSQRLASLLVVLAVTSLTACALVPQVDSSLTFDASDESIYGLVRRDGELSERRIRLVGGAERWQLLDQTDDGRWVDVTCTEHCLLAVASPDEVQRILRNKAMSDESARCMHNIAFAICRITNRGTSARRYLLVALEQRVGIQLRAMR